MVGFCPFQDFYHRVCILLVYSLRCWRTFSAPSPISVHISAGILLTVWSDLLAIVRVGHLRRRIESSCGRFFPFKYLYYCVCTLLVDFIHCLRRCSSPSPRYIHATAGRLLTVWADLPAIFLVGPLSRHIESSCVNISPVPRHLSLRVYSPDWLLTFFTSLLFSFSSIHTYIWWHIVLLHVERPSACSASNRSGTKPKRPLNVGRL